MLKLKITDNKYLSVLFSSGGASAITFLSYPLLALFYPIDSFGTLGVLNAYALIFSTLIIVRFDYFILSEKNKITKIRYLISGLICCFIFFALVACVGIISYLVNRSWDLILFACMTMFTAANNIFVFYLLSLDDVRVVNLGKFVRSIAIVALQFSGFYVLGSELGLVVGQTFGIAVTSIYLFVVARKNFVSLLRKINCRGISYNQLLIKSFMQNKEHIKYQLPQASLNSVSNNAMPIVIEFLFGVKTAGALFLVERFIKMPVGIIIDSTRPLIISDLSRRGLIESFSKTQNFSFYIIAGATIFTLATYLFEPTKHSFNLDFYDDISYLILPVMIMSFSVLSTLPLFCFFHAHKLSKHLLNSEVVRTLLLGMVFVIFSVFKFAEPVLFYLLCAFIMFIVPFLYFYSIKRLSLFRGN